MKTITKLIKEVSALKARGKWNEAVRDYALDLLGNHWDMFLWDRDANGGPRRSALWMEEHCRNAKLPHRKPLNGAESWREYGWSGNAVIDNWRLAKILLTKSELKRLGWKTNADGDPYGGRSGWNGGRDGCTPHDAQGRALLQAERIVAEAMGLDDGQLFILQELNFKPKRRDYGRK